MNTIQAQTNTWKTLSEVTFKIGQDDFGEVYLPVFSPNIKKIEGKEVTLSGFIIPFEGLFKPNHIILSSLPLAECFFCGSGGPETVAEVHLNGNVKYTEKKVIVKGKLYLNAADPEQLMYVLRDAEITGVEN